jgi:hypothetical protein
MVTLQYEMSYRFRVRGPLLRGDELLGKVTLIGAGLGGVFGFLVGAASPRYRWVRADAE